MGYSREGSQQDDSQIYTVPEAGLDLLVTITLIPFQMSQTLRPRISSLQGQGFGEGVF